MTMDSYLERLQQAIASATLGMTHEDLVRCAPGFPEGTWSPAEILEHLYLTYTGTIKGFDRCLQAGKPLAKPITLVEHMQIGLVIRLGHFPRGRKTPEMAAPKGMSADLVVAGIGPKIVAMGEVIAEAEARHGSRTRLINHPVLGPLTGSQWRKFHWVHGHHHVKQILQRRLV
jgi:Protein of unknown function (DUF1569)